MLEQKAHLSNLAGVKRDPFANLIQKEASRGVENIIIIIYYYCYKNKK